MLRGSGTRNANFLVLFIVPLSTIGSVGCTYTLGAHQLIAGGEYHRDRLAQLSRGMTNDEVLRVMGEPLERNRASMPVERWRYRAIYQQRACEVALFGIIPIERRPTEEFELILTFRAERLETARYVERRSTQTTERDLLTIEMKSGG